MRKRISSEDETSQDNDEVEIKEKWNTFQDTPRKLDSGSMTETKFFDLGEKCLKVGAYLITFIVVLSSAVISKGTLLFMTSQVTNDTRAYCNTKLGSNKQFVVTLPEIERATWIWMLCFSYFIPQLGTFIRSVRICCFKRFSKPKRGEMAIVFLTESLPTVGTALLIFCVLPEMDVVKGAMLTNAVCFVPAFVGFISRTPKCTKENNHTKICIQNTLKLNLDFACIIAQAATLVVWPLIEGKTILWWIPISVILISFGWWENYVSEHSSIKFIRKIAKSKKVFKNSRYYIYIFVSLWKCVLFFITTIFIIYVKDDLGLKSFFESFLKVGDIHNIFIEEIKPILPTENIPDISELISVGKGTFIETNGLTPMWVCLINILSTYICYIFGKFACKVKIQGFSYALPINLAMPVTISALVAICGAFIRNECEYFDTIPAYLFFDTPKIYLLRNFLGNQYAWIWLVWLLSQTWITIHIWEPTCERMARTERLYVRPMYDPFLIDQDIALNRRREDAEINLKDPIEKIIKDEMVESIKLKDNATRIYACGTMWHENKEEMMEFLKSIMRLDEDQSARKIVKNDFGFDLPDYYELETHIFFDDAYVRTKREPDPHINQYVIDLVEAVNESVSEVHETRIELRPPKKYETPYGGQLIWTLPGKTLMIAHLKDKQKIRAKKRWSQVMYMYYLLGYKLMERTDKTNMQKDIIAENTFILALDGDIDFQPKAVTLLVDLMKKNKSLGAACGRIHPIGSGPMVWYQMFEYAVGHWLQKATEHIIGCVLCSPGCFSLFRGKALMDDRVMKKYTTKSSEALHYVQYDQGEDRWLCTLLLQRGFRVEYSAASDAYTHAPEGFNEFYNQRRRWMPSTTANILDLLMDYKHTIKINDNISRLYILYQIVLMVGTVLGPGTIFLMLVGAFVAAFQLDQWSSFMWNVVPILTFMLALKLFKSDKVQLFFAALISAVYGLIMMAVLVGVMLQINNDGIFAPSSLFFFCVAGQFIITALLHPKEFNCLKYGVVYYVTVPSMYMLLVIYSVFNMNNVSWGTRELVLVDEDDKPEAPGAATAPKPAEIGMKNKVLNFLGQGTDTTGSFEFSLAGLFKCMLCTHEGNSRELCQLEEIRKDIGDIIKRLDNFGQEVEVVQPGVRRKTTILEMSGRTGSKLGDIKLNDGRTSDTTSLDDNYDSWLEDEAIYRGETLFIDNNEEEFWKGLLEKYLLPIDDSKDKARISQNLIDLRDKSVFAFFMLNALFVLVVFLLTLKKDLLHIKWPFDVKCNFTYYEENNGQIYMYKQHLQLEPIGFVFLIFFFSLLVVQFIAMILHRFGTMCQILSNTTINWSVSSSQDKKASMHMDETNVLENVRKLQKLKPDEEQERNEYSAPNRRMTISQNMQASKRDNTNLIYLHDKFKKRVHEYTNCKDDSKVALARRATVAMFNTREENVKDVRRKSMFQGNNNFAFEMGE